MEFWLPFIGTILSTIIIPITNYRQNKKQNEDNNKFKKEIQDDRQIFEEKISKQQINANIISKARIEWSQDVRIYVAEYLSVLSKVRAILERLIEINSLMDKARSEIEKVDLAIEANHVYSEDIEHQNFYVDEEKKLEKEKNDLVNRLNSYIEDIARKAEILLLYFSEKEEHRDIENLLIYPVNLNFQLEHSQLNNDCITKIAFEYNDIIFNLRKKVREYLKNEWEVAKKIE